MKQEAKEGEKDDGELDLAIRVTSVLFECKLCGIIGTEMS